MCVVVPISFGKFVSDIDVTQGRMGKYCEQNLPHPVHAEVREKQDGIVPDFHIVISRAISSFSMF